MSDDQKWLARLRPFDLRRGHRLRRYTYRGVRFQEGRGWYAVEPQVAVYLRSVRQVPSDPYSPLAFDVMTETDAKVTDDEESARAEPKRAAEQAQRTAARSEPEKKPTARVKAS